MVMVDELRRWPTRIRCFKAGSCHLTATTEEELHVFAERIGLRRHWFQEHSSPHYDLTGPKRALAVKYGAVFVPARDQARARIEARRAVGKWPL